MIKQQQLTCMTAAKLLEQELGAVQEVRKRVESRIPKEVRIWRNKECGITLYRYRVRIKGVNRVRDRVRINGVNRVRNTCRIRASGGRVILFEKHLPPPKKNSSGKITQLEKITS